MDNQTQSREVLTWEQQNQYLVSRGINEACWSVLCNTLYPSNKPESVILAWDYCEARGLDIMLKPIHLVPMQVKNPQTNAKEWRDVPMPGIGMYRIQADRSGNYAGAKEAEFGPPQTKQFQDAYNNQNTITVEYPLWCKYTVYKLIGGERVPFTAIEYWTENYATMKASSDCPNSMWKKRPYAQLAKCAEAQALRKAWPEIGGEPTAEEMEGKGYLFDEKDITPGVSQKASSSDQVQTLITRGIKAIELGQKTAKQIIAFIEGKGIQLSPEQEATLKSIKVAA